VHRRKKWIRDDSRGVGGFFEAILAVMIVTSGLAILLVSVNVAQGDDGSREDIDAQNLVREVCQELLADQRIVRPPYVVLLSNDYLWGEIVKDALSAFPSYRVTLIVDLESPRSILLAQKGSPDVIGEVVRVRLPVDVEITPSRIHVGILEVIVRQ